jgi:hypothetical protein
MTGWRIPASLFAYSNLSARVDCESGARYRRFSAGRDDHPNEVAVFSDHDVNADARELADRAFIRDYVEGSLEVAMRFHNA